MIRKIKQFYFEGKKPKDYYIKKLLEHDKASFLGGKNETEESA